MIKEIDPGQSSVKYQFIAAVTMDPMEEPIPALTFSQTKAKAKVANSKVTTRYFIDVNAHLSDFPEERIR